MFEIADLNDVHIGDEIRVELPYTTITGTVGLFPRGNDAVRITDENGNEHTLTEVSDEDIVISTTTDEQFVDEIEITDPADY